MSVKEETRRACHAYKATNAEYEIATLELQRRCGEGRRAGIPVAEIAKLAHVSRQTIYEWTAHA